jgi:hypothetical protein
MCSPTPGVWSTEPTPATSFVVPVQTANADAALEAIANFDPCVAFPSAQSMGAKMLVIEHASHVKEFRARIHKQLQDEQNWRSIKDGRRIVFAAEVSYDPTLVPKEDLKRVKQELRDADYTVIEWVDTGNWFFGIDCTVTL